MDEVNYIPGDEMVISFTVNGMRGKIYKIEKVSSLNVVYILKTVLAEMTTYSSGEMILHYRGLVRDNFAIDYYGLGEGRNVPLRPCLHSNPTTRRILR